MPSIHTTIGRGLQSVQVNYEIWTDTPEELGVEVQEVYFHLRPAAGDGYYKVDVSGLLTEEVYQSLESDCLAHEIAERERLADGDPSLEPELDAIGGY